MHISQKDFSRAFIETIPKIVRNRYVIMVLPQSEWVIV